MVRRRTKGSGPSTSSRPSPTLRVLPWWVAPLLCRCMWAYCICKAGCMPHWWSSIQCVRGHCWWGACGVHRLGLSDLSTGTACLHVWQSCLAVLDASSTHAHNPPPASSCICALSCLQASSLYMAFVFQKVDQPEQACAPDPEQQQRQLKRRREEEQQQARPAPPGRHRDDRHEGPPAHWQQAAPHHSQHRPYPPQQPPQAAGAGYHPPGPMSHAGPGGYAPPPAAAFMWPPQVR